MNNRAWILLAALVLSLTPLMHPATALAQGTAFTYQGRLENGSAPVNGNYDLQFALYTASVTGGVVAGPVTNSAIAVSNGLFTTTVDFGPGVFTGQALWLGIGVSPAGSNTFTELAPRQPVTPTPYAVQAANAATAGSVAAANINGTIAVAQLPAAVVTNGATNVNIAGTFTGNGADITGVNLLNVNSDGVIVWTTNWGNYALASSPPTGNGPFSVTTADVNGDGRLDLISANQNDYTLTVLTNNGRGGFTLAATLSTGDYTQPSSVVAADVNGDGHVDLISANYGVNTLTVLTNNGGGGFAIASSPAVGAGPESVVAADINGDGYVDLICANLNGNTLTVLTNNGRGGFSIASSPAVGGNPESVVAADVNGDGFLDLISANYADGTLTVLTNNGSGGFTMASSPAAGDAPIGLAAADVNGDGHVDLISANPYGNTLTVLTNNGRGGFVIASVPVVDFSPFAVTTADVNGDGHVDLISANIGANTLTVLTNNGSGGFAIASSPAVGNRSYSVTAADVNGDGHVDLISANNVDNTLTVLTNYAIINDPVIGGSGATFAGTTFSGSAFSGGSFSGSFAGSFSGNGSSLSWGINAYTPTIGDGTHNFTTSTATGTYTQMGNVTFVEIWLVWTGKGSATATAPLRISLPFASGSSPRAMFTLGYVNGVAFNSQLTANANLGQAFVNLWSLQSSGSLAVVTVNGCAANGEIQLSGFFRR